MKELFEQSLMYFCLAGIGLVAVVAILRAAAQKIKAVSEGVRKNGIVAAIVVAVFTCGMIVYGSTKNNSQSNDPPNQMQMPVNPALACGAQLEHMTGILAFNGSGLMPMVLPGGLPQLVGSPSPFPSNNLVRVEKWWRRGGFNDGHIVTFDNDWCFPYGTNHLTSVEAWASGAVYASEKDPNPIAELLTKLSLAPHDTEVFVGRTTNNSYRIEWHGGHPNRDLNQTLDASIELFRNGDWCVTEDGAARWGQRALPFPHVGYGQDEAWVQASFTNDEEILAIGYPQWVDQQVGSELTNGLYKLTVSVPEEPPETTYIFVGNQSVAVTNAGNYVFLLEKAVDYQLSVFPRDATNFEYTVADDVAQTRTLPQVMLRGSVNSPRYSVRLYSQVEESSFELVLPTRAGDGHIVYYPQLSIIPENEYDPAFPVLLGAYVLDIPLGRDASYVWSAPGISETGPYWLWLGDEDVDVIEVQATYGDVVLTGSVHIERHIRENSISLIGGGLIVSEDSYTNAPGDVVAASSTSVRLDVSWALAEAGTIRLDSTCQCVVELTEECGGVRAPVALPREWTRGADDEDSFEFFASTTNFSATGDVGVFTLTFTPADSSAPTLTSTASMRVVKIKVEALADWPSNKVRHVFGPKESFRIVQTPQSPALSYTVAEESSAYASNNGCMAPDRPGLFNITISANSLCNNLTFNCIAPTGLCGGNPRTLTVDEWHALRRIPLQGGEMGVLMHIDTWLEPLYVSFAKVRLYEGECPASNLTGWFLDQDQFPASLLAHDAAAGASSDPSAEYATIRDEGNYTQNGDTVGFLLYDATNNFYQGSYQLNIPLKWYVYNSLVTNALPDNVQTIWVLPNGAMRVNKNGVTWERRLDGQELQVEE